MNPVVKRFARNLKKARTARGLTLAEVSRRVQVSRAYMTLLEQGQREPSIVTVVKLAKALGVKPGTLLE
jgi:HTH-type transcriptional regulator, competence development regulator